MDDEQKILNSFRAMDKRRKQEAVIRMDRIAKTHPDHARPSAKLRLVGGGAGDSGARSLGGGMHNLKLTIGVGPVVKVK